MSHITIPKRRVPINAETYPDGRFLGVYKHQEEPMVEGGMLDPRVQIEMQRQYYRGKNYPGRVDVPYYVIRSVFDVIFRFESEYGNMYVLRNRINRYQDFVWVTDERLTVESVQYMEVRVIRTEVVSGYLIMKSEHIPENDETIEYAYLLMETFLASMNKFTMNKNVSELL